MTAKYVVFYLGLARVVDMFTSVNGAIIHYSRYFRFMLIALLLMAVMNIWLNFLLIPIFSFTGSAIATLISMICFNLAKLLFIQLKFKMHPFSWESLGLILIAGLTFLLGIFLPASASPLFNIVFRSTVCAGFFILIVFRFKLSPDLQLLILETFRRIGVKWERKK